MNSAHSHSSHTPSTRPDSPTAKDSGPANLQHLQFSDHALYSNSNPNHLFNEQLSSSGLHGQPDYGSDLDSQKSPPIPQSAKSTGLPSQNSSYRSSFTSFPNANRTRQGTASSISSFRDPASSFYANSAAEPFSPEAQLTSPTGAQMPGYDPRASYDYGGNGLGSAAHKSSFSMDPYVNGPSLPSKGPQQQGSYSQQGYGGSVQIASQTPYGPHIPIVANGQAPMGNAPPSSQGQHEDISTIFVVGFPEDMQEREFQNMFTFSSGFEAATLKIPNKDHGGYNPMGGQGGNARNQNYNQYGGSNDPYNLVTLNQGGVLVDTGRDGTMSSWPAPEDGPGPHYVAPYPPPGGQQQRKQIIGFAKFRTREEALIARDVLQGRRVDIEKGAVLKAEMAKKNLHTKRGPSGGGPMAPNNAGPMGPLPPLNQLQGNLMGLGSDQYAIAAGLPQDQLAARDRDLAALGALGKLDWPNPQEPVGLGRGINGVGSRDDDDRRRERDANNYLHGMSVGTRGPRERAEEEWERRAKENEVMLLRGHNAAAYDAFHSVPQSGPLSARLQPGFEVGGGNLGPIHSNVNGHSPLLSHEEAEVSGRRNDPQQRLSNSQRSSSPVNHSAAASDSSRPYSPNREADFHSKGGVFTNPFPSRHRPSESSASSSSSIGAGGSPGSNELVGDATLIASEKDIQHAMGNLDLNTQSEPNGTTSPQLPSPSSNSNTSSASTRNMVDQNPPINTLYVGNLPTSPPPPGFPHDHLEDSLRELFSGRPGFKKLCFRHKSNGPMCFVEFDDVSYATRALNDLYGHTLNGLVKGGGIRLSYSKNPLGVRTPTSATSSNVLQQQQPQPHYGYQHDSFGPRHFGGDEPRYRGSGAVVSPPPHSATSSSFGSNYMMASPPPRFSAPATSFGAPPPSSASFAPRGSTASYEYGLPSSASVTSTFSPFSLQTPPHSSIPEQSLSEHDHHFLPGAVSSPPLNHIEAARVG